MRSLNLILLSLVVLIALNGCANKQSEIKVEYIYKTKIKYVYLACEKQVPIQKVLIKKKVKAQASKQKKFTNPMPTKLYAPKKYMTRPNQKMNFMMGFNQDGSEFIYLEGEFGKHTYNNFIKFVKESSTTAKEIKISSNGGLVSTAMQLGSYVYDNGWSTGLDKEMHCYSACGFVYFAGRSKSLQGQAKVGLHRPYLPGVKDTKNSIRKVKEEYISYWNYINASKSVYDEMMEIDRDNLFILNRNNINDYVDVEIN